MLRFRGDRSTLLAALLAHWSEQQLAIPAAALQGATRSMIHSAAPSPSPASALARR
ncbi:hypothetical protein KBY65_11165 [Cyanobium sp. Alchichica 3B3-8F6]|uniref:hypothetical protein n=1 Tax=Cyanobium sp. Alchichica 3B3-8F6 TaxID=2823696 RepID=UPI0020CE1392|nr:hypothetical protein [Cyanobium sp. Alchichica 3B3-8F6]MCP9883028.1 hypothetical protein [Cyanobium sp. Alchichica 3B3-8F6]